VRIPASFALAALVLAGAELKRIEDEDTPEEREARARRREIEANERRWAEMTQADIDRLTAAEEKRTRRGKR